MAGWPVTSASAWRRRCLSEILEQIPIANSIITGIAFGSSTFIIGLAWLAIVEQSYFAQNADAI